MVGLGGDAEPKGRVPAGCIGGGATQEMAPYDEASHTDASKSVHHTKVTEDGLSSEGGDHVADHTKAGDDHEVHLRVSEEPEEQGGLEGQCAAALVRLSLAQGEVGFSLWSLRMLMERRSLLAGALGVQHLRMLVQDGVTPSRRVVEGRVEVTVRKDHGQRAS